MLRVKWVYQSQGFSKNFFGNAPFCYASASNSLKIKHLILFSRRNGVSEINLSCLVDIVHSKNAIKKAWVTWHWQCRAVDLTLLHMHSYWFFFFSSFWHFTWFNPRFITLEMSSLRLFFLLFGKTYLWNGLLLISFWDSRLNTSALNQLGIGSVYFLFLS